MTGQALAGVKLAIPDVRLHGAVDDLMFQSCIAQFDGLVPRADPIVVQLTARPTRAGASRARSASGARRWAGAWCWWASPTSIPRA